MNRKELMTIANAIHTHSDSNLKQSLTIAHRVYKLKKQLRKGKHSFSFIKKDGSVRLANGTLADVPPIKGTSTAKVRHDVIAYYDLDKKGWRSFKAETLLVK